MIKYLIFLILTCGLFFSSVFVSAQSQVSGQKTIEGVVKEKYQATCKNDPNNNCQYLSIYTYDGKQLPPVLINQNITAEQIKFSDWKPKDRVIITETTQEDGTSEFYVRDPDRQQQLWIFALIILIVAFLVARFKGLMAILALILSTFIIFGLFIPQILNGGSVLFWGFVTTCIILCINQLIGHGFSVISFIGLLSGFITLLISWLVGWLVTSFFRLSGGTGEEVMYLISEKGASFDFRGLFLVGVMIGVTGAIDDIVAAQISSVQELTLSNRNLKFHELFGKAMKIGKEHIVSMINTLFLAYAGASLPLLLLFALNLDQSVTQLLSREDLTEEIVRTGIGSLALLFVVPLSTLCAVLYFKRPTWINQKNKPFLTR